MPSGVPQNEPKTTQNGPKRPQDGPKRDPRRPKTTPRGAQDDQKKRSRTTRRKKDRTKTILGPSWTPPGPICTAQPCFGVPCWRPKRHQNRSENDQKSKRKIKRQKSHPRRSWTRLGAILGRSWPHLEVNFGQKPLENVMFREQSLFRR